MSYCEVEDTGGPGLAWRTGQEVAGAAAGPGRAGKVASCHFIAVHWATTGSLSLAVLVRFAVGLYSGDHLISWSNCLKGRTSGEPLDCSIW